MILRKTTWAALGAAMCFSNNQLVSRMNSGSSRYAYSFAREYGYSYSYIRSLADSRAFSFRRIEAKKA